MLTREYLLHLFHYNRERGVLLWKNHWNRNTISRLRGKIAGWLDNGYLRVTISNETFFVHQLIWFIETGNWPEEIDHINGHTLDNRIENLRNGPPRLNHWNNWQHREGHLPGTTFDKRRQKWIAQTTVNYKHIFLGRFDTRYEAYDAYLKFVYSNDLEKLQGPNKKHRQIIPSITENKLPNAKGVTFHKASGLYRARTKLKGKEICLGYFKTPEEAHKKYLDFITRDIL